MQLHEVQTQEEWKRMYRERGEVIREALKDRRENGEATGAPPVGYRIVVGPDGKKRVEEDPVMGPLVREAQELYASGQYSIRSLLAIMTRKGLRSRNGQPMTHSALFYILRRTPPIFH